MAQPPSDDRFYKGNSLLKAFAVSSMVMFVFTIWMLLDDFGREWKGYQREFFELKKKKFEAQIESAKGQLDENKIKEIQEGLKRIMNQGSLRSVDVLLPHPLGDLGMLLPIPHQQFHLLLLFRYRRVLGGRPELLQSISHHDSE